jgi:radical SAM superfamily enzyme YgiQ (UPF0313 family)
MRIAFVFNPFRYKVHEENIRIVQKYFGLFPPLSMSWVAAIAEKAGHEVILIDARTLRLSQQETLEILCDFKPDILGFMMTTYMFPETLDWIRFMKRTLNVPVMVGGYNLRVYPKESISHPEIDFGVVEHAYFTVPALLEELGKKEPNFENVPGLAYKKNGEIIVTPHPQKIVFDDFPNPARHLLPNELYAEFPTERRNFTVMVTSLGCPYGCGFCEAGRTPYNPRSPETVIREIQECYEKYGVREIDIFDYEFTGDKKRVSEICRLILEKKFDILWACRSRIDTVDRELLAEMHAAGCRRIYFGIESGVESILQCVHKGITLQKVEQTIKDCKEIGIKTLGFFLVGAPGETYDTFRQTLAFAKKLDLDYVQFSKCLAKPLTPLWKEMVATEGRDYWKDWILGLETDRPLPRPWTVLSNEEIDRLARNAYISYHGHFGRLWKAILQVKSWKELKRKSGAFWDMLFSQEKTSTMDQKFRAFNENQKDTLEACRQKLRIFAARKKI